MSMRVSPFAMLVLVPPTLMTSADSLFPATSKDVRVRVEASRKKLMIVFPLSVESFFVLFGVSKDFAESNIFSISLVGKLLISSKSFLFSIYQLNSTQNGGEIRSYCGIGETSIHFVSMNR